MSAPSFKYDKVKVEYIEKDLVFVPEFKVMEETDLGKKIVKKLNIDIDRTPTVDLRKHRGLVFSKRFDL